MKVFDYFSRAGTKISIEGNQHQLLEDASYVWMIEQGKASVFLTALTDDNATGVKHFLFEVVQGDLIFGIKPEGLPYKKTLLISGSVGTYLRGLKLDQFRKLIRQEVPEEIPALLNTWLEALDRVASRSMDLQEEAATMTEKPSEANQYLIDTDLMEVHNRRMIQAISRSWELEQLIEKKRLQEKFYADQRRMENAVSGLASIHQRKGIMELKDISGSPLLDACRLIGQAMGIDIITPPADSYRKNNELDLEIIVRASHIRIRRIALHGDWYRQDCGPILGYMADDNRPVALIPSTPNSYILHDPTTQTQMPVDDKISGAIKEYGSIFYRSFDNKPINIKDLIIFGLESCWKRDLVMIAVMSLLGGLLGTAIPIATGIVFNSIIPEGERGQLLQVTFFLGASAIAAMLFQLTRSLAIQRIEGKMESGIQSAVWDRLLSLPVPFYRQFTAGELAMRAMGISQIRMILSGVTLNTILSSTFSIFTLALLFYYDGGLAWIAVILAASAIIVMALLGYWQVRYEGRVLEIANNLSGKLLQFIGGINKFRVAGAENRVFFHWAKDFTEQRRVTFQKGTLSNCLATFNNVFPTLASIIIFYALASTARMSPGQFIAFNAAFISFILMMMALSEALISANIVIPLYQRAKPILETLPEYDDTKVDPGEVTGAIEVSHVSFRYEKERPLVLKDISFEIQEGDYVAIVGTSGCGKSTLFRILLGFEKPESGKIYYSGKDLDKIDIRAVRRQLGVVLQNGQLMVGSIFSNIVGANPYLTIDNAWEAAKMAGIEADIKAMPMGMHTVVGEGAGTISGGQKQRIMIARAIIKKPKIIFFDEATSALDNETQAIVSKSLDQLQATRIVIAHRLSTIKNCNKIIVMDKGSIVERGTYQELMDKEGIFANLAKRQLT